MRNYIAMGLRDFLIIALVIILVLLLFKACNNKPLNPVIKTVTHDTTYVQHWDSVPKIIYVKQPRIIDSVFVSVPTDVDTAAILKKYYTAFYYKQVIADTAIEVTVTDTVTQNKIAARGFSYKLLKPSVIKIINNTTTIEGNKYALYGGAFISSDKVSMPTGFGLQAIYTIGKFKAYNVSYDIRNKNFSIGASVNFLK